MFTAKGENQEQTTPVNGKEIFIVKLSNFLLNHLSDVPMEI